MDLRKYFDRVVLVGLDRRPERRARVLNLLRRRGWPFKDPEIFSAVDGNVVEVPAGWKSGRGAWGCLRSHQLILEQAIADGIDNVLILEDDIVFEEDFRHEVATFLDAVPNDWDQLMIGGQHKTDLGWPISINSRVTRVVACERTHCYAVSKNFMRRLSQRWTGGGPLNGEVHCDWIMARDPEMQRAHRVYAPTLFLVGQCRSYSDLMNRVQPKMYWNPPGPKLPLIRLRCPIDVASELMRYGFFYGLDADAAAGQIRRLGYLLYSNQSQPTATVDQLSSYIIEMQWQVASDPRLLAAIVHPEITDDLIQKASLWKVHYISASSVEGALEQLPRRMRRKRIAPICEQAIVLYDGPRIVAEAMQQHGWYFGTVEQESPRVTHGELHEATPIQSPRSLPDLIVSLQRQAGLDPNGISVIASQNGTAAELHRHTGAKVIQISAQTLGQAIDLWEREKLELDEPPQ